MTSRRDFLIAAAGAAGGIGLAVSRHAHATPAEMQDAIRKVTGGAPVREGRVKPRRPHRQRQRCALSSRSEPDDARQSRRRSTSSLKETRQRIERPFGPRPGARGLRPAFASRIRKRSLPSPR
jgi:hypothetical protein